MEIIGLIAAMHLEIEPLLKRAGKSSRCNWGPFKGYRLRLSNLDCALIECGIGTRRADQATKLLLSESRPRLLVSFGIAGALEAELKVGDVVFIQTACVLAEGRPQGPRTLASFSSAAKSAAAQALAGRASTWLSGTTVTTKGSAEIRLEGSKFTHPLLDMETSAIAQIASQEGIPLLSLRSISDNPTEPLPFAIEDWYDEEDNLAAGKVVGAILQRPGLLPRLFKLNQNSKLASENLAVALIASLSKLGFEA